MPRILAHDVSFHYEESGVGTPVLLLHGHPLDCTMWSPQLQADFPGYRLIAPDLRNLGLTTSPTHATDFTVYAHDILTLAEALHLTRFVVVGLSMGGHVAMELAHLAPHRLLGLVLSDTYAPLDSPEKQAGRGALADRLKAEGMRTYASEALPKLLSASTIAHNPQLAAQVLAMMERSPAAGAADALRVRSRHRDYLSVLRSLDLMTLILVGSEDQFTPVSEATLMHENFRNSTLVVIPDTGLLPNMEDPETFNQHLQEFLQTI